jgi:hypothetical protein
MYSNTGEIVTDEFAFASVDATTDFQAKGSYSITERVGTSNRPSRAVKCSKKPIACGADLASTIMLQHFADLHIEFVQQFAPGIVADGRNTFG